MDTITATASEIRSGARELDATFPGLLAYLARRFGARTDEISAAPIGGDGAIKKGGYGTPWLVSFPGPDGGDMRLVLETVRPGGFGHEDRADRAAIVIRAADEASALPFAVPVVAVGALRPPRAASLENTGELFMLMPFVEGEPYARDLERIAAAGELTPLDRARALALAEYLAEIHREPASHPTWWRRRLRDLCGAGEGIAGIADSYPEPCGFITPALLARVESLALEWRYRLHDRGERLRTVHGDFHPWNLLFSDGVRFRVLDRSRGALGEPADDVTALAVNYLFFALRTHGVFDGPFAELFRLFWERYGALSGDAGLAGVAAPFFAFRALVLASPLWYPNETEDVRRKLFRFLLGVLEADRFAIEEIPVWISRSDP